MKKLVSAIFSVLAFFTISCAYADQSPESIVSCNHNGYYLSAQTISAAVNDELCTWAEDKCATCISSLEDQGCKVIDVDFQTNRFVEELDKLDDLLVATYLLSCDRR